MPKVKTEAQLFINGKPKKQAQRSKEQWHLQSAWPERALGWRQRMPRQSAHSRICPGSAGVGVFCCASTLCALICARTVDYAQFLVANLHA